MTEIIKMDNITINKTIIEYNDTTSTIVCTYIKQSRTETYTKTLQHYKKVI